MTSLPKTYLVLAILAGIPLALAVAPQNLDPCATTPPEDEDYEIPDRLGDEQLPNKHTYIYTTGAASLKGHTDTEKEGFWEETNGKAHLQTDECASYPNGKRILHYPADTFRGKLVP